MIFLVDHQLSTSLLQALARCHAMTPAIIIVAERPKLTHADDFASLVATIAWRKDEDVVVVENSLRRQPHWPAVAAAVAGGGLTAHRRKEREYG